MATECYANIVRTGDLLIGMHDRQAADQYRLSGTAKNALAIIEGNGAPLEPSLIAERLIVTSGTVTSLLDTLERRGLIERLPHPDDRRKLLVEITPAGEEILQQLLPALHQRERVLMEVLSPAEQERLIRLLARVQAAAAEVRDRPHESFDASRRRPARLRRGGAPRR